MAHDDFVKWYMPGWRIEQRYAPGVLIGNWAEERNTFRKGSYLHNSTHRIDFKNYGGHRPDVVIRRSAVLKNDGLGREHLFRHHGNQYSNNMVSLYDEYYNGRWQENRLPKLRNWNSHQLAWAPEKSDLPLQASPTNFGLLKKLQDRWQQQIADETKGDYLSTYQVSYAEQPNDGLVKLRCANSREDSSTLHKYNLINKDLNLRNTTAVKSPEKVSQEMTNVSC